MFLNFKDFFTKKIDDLVTVAFQLRKKYTQENKTCQSINIQTSTETAKFD